ncbi:hypothetical protein [Streptomyces sp. TR06-5]|uniref:hypothetical protein n=1 Tax=unclassified Streptomyces TaxID=2593676 RepID=UPI0039A0C37F
MRSGHTSLGLAGVPLLGCALLVLLPGADVAAAAPGPRAVPAPVPCTGVPHPGSTAGSFPGAEGDDDGWEARRTPAPQPDRGPAREPDAEAVPEAGVAEPAGAVQPWSPAPVAPRDATRDGTERTGTERTGTEPSEPAEGGGRAALHDEGAAPAGARASAGPVVPVLSLGAGFASLGLGLAFLALRMRRG